MGDIMDLGLDDRTVSLWFKTTATWGLMIGKGYSRTSNIHAIHLYNGNLTALMDISGTDRIVSTTTTVNDGKWHHVALTIDRDGNMVLYLDGVSKSTVDISADANVDSNTTYPFQIGRANKSTEPNYFDGTIDDVKIFKKVFSSTEATALYNSYE
jgi:Concanavalin A-like lectin/glucanases superfamily